MRRAQRSPRSLRGGSQGPGLQALSSELKGGGKVGLGLPVPFPRDVFEGAATAKFVFLPGGES